MAISFLERENLTTGVLNLILKNPQAKDFLKFSKLFKNKDTSMQQFITV